MSSAELANRTVGIEGIGPWGRRALTFSIIVLVLSACALTIAEGEARAEEQPLKQTPQRGITPEGKVVLDKEGAEPATEDTRPAKSTLAETPSVRRPSAGSSAPPTMSLPGPKHHAPAPAPQLEPSYRHELATPPAYAQATTAATRTLMKPGNAGEAAPEPHPESEGTPGHTGTPNSTTATALPADPPGPKPEPVAFDEDVPAARLPLALPAEEGMPVVGTAPIGPLRAQAADVRPREPAPSSVPASAKEAVSLAAQSVLGTALYNPVGTLGGAAGYVWGDPKGAASTEELTSGSAEDPSGPSGGGVPQRPSPSTPAVPLGSGPFSLSVVGGISQVSAGGVPPTLLAGVMALVAILLRPEGVLWRVFCEVPRPSSALLSPLKRPG